MNALNAAILEKALREQERRHQPERDSLIKFIEYFFQNELGKTFDTNWHHYLIEEHLQKVLTGEITRLIISIPPGAGKTELITKCFPVWAMGKRPDIEIIVTGYSASLTQNYGAQARDYYNSDTYGKVFPRRTPLREDQNTKALWKNEDGGQYLATGTGGSITGNRANIFVIDDPLKPDEAKSDVKRESINKWYDNTVLSRLYNANKDAVIIVHQRTHENDLTGYLLEKQLKGTGEEWTHLVVKAIAEEDEKHRKLGESYHEERVPLTALEKIQKNDPNVFSSQYQQEPVNKDNQEFHEEFFKYYQEPPLNMRVFTVVDPAFKTKQENDETSIVTGGFVGDTLYILELTHGRFNASELVAKTIFHLKKWRSEKLGVEGVAAQTVLAQWLKKTMTEEKVYVPVDEITQKGDKESKIRGLQGPIQHGKILWKPEMFALENQLKKFPRGKHDDIIDSVQMLYYFYTIQPNVTMPDYNFRIEYDELGRPIFN